MYPETVLCEESASIGWARVIRGIDSIAKATTPREARRSIPSGSVSGCRNAISTVPSRSLAASASVGARTFTIASASSGESSTVAPASA